MTQRERNLLLTLLAVAGGAAILGLAYLFLLRPLADIGDEEEKLNSSIAKKEQTVIAMLRDQQIIKIAKQRSLPSQPHKAAIDYERYLHGVLKDAKLVDVILQGATNLDVKAPVVAAKGKKANQTVVGFTVRAKGTLASVVDLFTRLQNTPVLHRVKRFSLDRIDPKDTSGKLSVNLEVEALIYQDVESTHEPKLAPLAKIDPPGVHPERAYAKVGLRNFFLGFVPPPPPSKPDVPVVKKGLDMRRYVALQMVVPTSAEAFISNRLRDEPPDRLSTEKGYTRFVVRDEEKKPYLSGEVVQIQQRAIFVRIDSKVYGWHLGDTLYEAMQAPLTAAELTELGIGGGKTGPEDGKKPGKR